MGLQAVVVAEVALVVAKVALAALRQLLYVVAEVLIEATCPTETGTAEGKEGAWSPGTGTALADELVRVGLPAILEQDQLVRVGLPVKAGRGVQAGSYPVRRWPQVAALGQQEVAQELEKAKWSLRNVIWMHKSLKVTFFLS